MIPVKTSAAALFAALLLLLALACGGSSNEVAAGGISGTGGIAKVTGSIVDSSMRSKSEDALTGSAVDLDTQESYTVSIVGRTYSVSVKAAGNILIEIRNGSTVILSRLLPSTVTNNFGVKADINAVSHAHAKMATHLFAQGKSPNLRAAVLTANLEFFGAAAPTEAMFTLPGLSAAGNGDLAAGISVVQQMVSRPIGEGEARLIPALSDCFGAENKALAISAFSSRVNGLSAYADAVAFALSLEEAENSRIVAFNHYQELRNRITRQYVLQVLAAAETAPAFGVLSDVVRTAAPGLLFQYSFPEASTLDLLGLAGYKGSFEGTRSGSSYLGLDKGRTVRFIPAPGEMNTNFNYTLDAVGANNRDSSLSIRIYVSGLDVIGKTRLKIGSSSDGVYRPLLGPVASGNSIYLVSMCSGPAYRLERYDLAEIAEKAYQSSGTLSMSTWYVSSSAGEVRDFLVHGDNAYLATANSGVQNFDLSSAPGSGPAKSEPLMNADRLALAGTSLYGLRSSDRLVMRCGLDLGSPLSLIGEGSLSEKAAAIQATEIGAWGSNLLIAGGNTAAFYNPAKASFIGDLFSATGNISLAADPMDISGGPLTLTGGGNVYSLKAAGSSWSLASTAAITATGELRAAAANATCAITIADSGLNVLALYGSSDFVYVSSPSGSTLEFANTGRLRPLVINLPGGIPYKKCGAWLLVPGQYSASGAAAADLVGSWHLTPYLMEARD